MILDSSAVIAILRQEHDWLLLSEAMDRADSVHFSAASFLETAIVLDKGKDPILSTALDDLIEDAEITIEPFTPEQARIARQAYRDYGKGSGHRANLNYGDCFSYALARSRREPILFKGDDFVHTDLRSALDD